MSYKETQAKIITKVYLILALWSKDITTKSKEGHKYIACSVIHNITQLPSGFLPFTLFCNISFHHHTHPLCRCSFHSHTHHTTICTIRFILSIIKHTPNNTIICKTHASFYKIHSRTFKSRRAHSGLLPI